MSHWWSPGFHSSLTLSSNAPSQESFVMGTLRKIHFNRFSLNTQIILMPYKNKNNNQIYFSGLRTEFTFQSYPVITFGFHRTFLSGEFDQSNHNGNSPIEWSKEDAIRLIVTSLTNLKKA